MANNEVRASIEKNHYRDKLRAHKKISKPVLYDGVIYNSAAALARAQRLESHNAIYSIIKRGILKGKPVSYYKGVNNGKNSHRS